MKKATEIISILAFKLELEIYLFFLHLILNIWLPSRINH